MKKLLLITSIVLQITGNEPQVLNCIQNPAIQLTAKENVIVKNAITQDMITYKQHWSGHHTPKIWNLRINGKEIDQNQSTKVKIKNNTLKVVFYFEFWALGRVQRKGIIEAHYKILLAKNYEVQFSWDNPQRLLLITKDDTKRKNIKSVYFIEKEIK